MKRVWSVLWRSAILIFALVFAVLLASAALSGIAWCLDKFDVVKRSLDALAPYTGLLTWSFVLAFVYFIVQIPDFRKEITAFIHRIENVKTAGGVEVSLFRNLEMDEEERAALAALITAAVKDGIRENTIENNDKRKPTGAAVAKVLQEQNAEHQIALSILNHICSRQQAVPYYPKVSSGFPLRRFDGCYAIGGKITFVEIKVLRDLNHINEIIQGLLFALDDIKQHMTREDASRCVLHLALGMTKQHDESDYEKVKERLLRSGRNDMTVSFYYFKNSCHCITETTIM